MYNTPLYRNGIPSLQFPVAFFSRMCTATLQNLCKNIFRNTTISWLGLQIIPISIQLRICGTCWKKTVQSTEASPRNLYDLKKLLLTVWWQIPQHTLRGQVDFITWCSELFYLRITWLQKRNLQVWPNSTSNASFRTTLTDIQIGSYC